MARKHPSIRWLARKRCGSMFAVAWTFDATNGARCYRGSITQASAGWRAIAQTLYLMPDYARAHLRSIECTQLHRNERGALAFPNGSSVLGWGN